MIAFGLFLLCAVDLGLFWLARRLQVASHDMEKGQVPLGWAVCATSLGFAAHIFGGIIAKSIMPGDDIISVHIMLWSIITGLPAGAVMAMIISDSCSGHFANSLYMSDPVPSILPEMQKARQWVREEKLEEAEALYIRIARANPTDPDPMFGLAMLQRGRESIEEAKTTYRSLLSKFQADDETWSKASLLLADILELNDGDHALAISMRRKVRERSGYTMMPVEE
jgi:hypothetical protein